MVKLSTTSKETALIGKIVRRAEALGLVTSHLGRLEVAMDVTAVHANDFPLRLKDLLEFDDFNFAHDIAGISRHIDRTTGKLQGFFLPRCAR